MDRKKINKIGLSLLVATLFLMSGMSAAAVSISNEKGEAGEIRETETTKQFNEIQLPNAPIDQAKTKINPAGVKMVAPDGDETILSPGMTMPIEDFYDLYVGTTTVGDCPRGTAPDEIYPAIQAGLSLYEVTEGIDVVMYETSFEDNFDIYNNWVQIDDDCGYGGYYDSFSWSDARSSDGDHSMKSTMYDIYKGNQDDFLMNTNCFNVSDQDGVKVEFDIWVEGQDNQDNTFAPTEFYDYLSFEIFDGTDWINPFPILFSDTTLPLYAPRWGWDITDFVEELGDGWWRVTLDMSKQDLITAGFDPDCLMFRFDWHTDPQFQYEGAYVDNFKVISVEGVKEKIWQTHLQDCTEIDCGTDWTKFPLAWDEVEPGTYMFKVWVEECARGYRSMFPKGQDYYIEFEVGDNLDCEITSITVEDSFTHETVEDGGIMNEGADAHIMFDFHNDGNVPVSNVPISLNVYEKNWETLLFDQFDNGLGLVDSVGYQITDFDYWSEDSSLAFWEPDYKVYATDAFYYITFGQSIDLENAEEMYLDYYTKFATESSDYMMPYLYDSNNFYLLSTGYTATYEPENIHSGYQPDWIGPDQPCGKYDHWDMKACYEYYKAAGFFRDYSGNLVDKVQFGFYFAADGDDTNYNQDALDDGIMWSGVFLDDVKVSGLTIGDEVYSDSLVLPGTYEYCDTASAQFEWEDVPYSRYKICVQTDCENDVDMTNNEKCQQILVASDLERIDKPEGVDYTNGCTGSWGRCTSDTDYYLSSNPDSEYYPVDTMYSAYYDGCIDTAGTTPVLVEFDYWHDLELDWDYVYLQVADECPAGQETDWMTVEVFNHQTSDTFDGVMDGSYLVDTTYVNDSWWHGTWDITTLLTDTDYSVRFVMDSDISWTERGFLVDDFYATGMDAVDTMDTMDNWYFDCNYMGNYWDDVALPYCIDPIPLLPINNALVWSTEVEDAYEAWLTIDYDYNLTTSEGLFTVGGNNVYWQGVLQISTDGSTWYCLDEFTGTATGTETYDITTWAGQEILIRVLITEEGPAGFEYVFPLFGIPDGGYFCIDDMTIAGKKDDTPPTTDLTMSGTMKETGWYTTCVQITITAEDEGAGMGEIHYILDGTENVVEGDEASFSVCGNGEHTLEYWAVDALGNEGEHKTIQPFKIDSGEAPTVEITAPEPGLYLFGKKLLSIDKVVIIGAFTAEANAQDDDSGIYKVSFYLDDELIGEDTEAPFSQYVATKHMGAGTLKVVAEDFAQNTAEDTLDLKYYKFF